MSNSFTCAGNLGDNAVMEMAGNTPVLKFSVANNVGWGEKRTTLWIGCALFGNRAEKLQQFLLKGTKVFVRGELSMNVSSQGKSFLNLNVDDVDVLVKVEGAAPQQQHGGFTPNAPQQGGFTPNAPQQGGFTPNAPQQNAPAQQQNFAPNAPQQNFAPNDPQQNNPQQNTPAQQQNFAPNAPAQQPQGAPNAPTQPQNGATPFDQMFT